MDHNYAIENHTAERYLMEELPQDERDAYEEHFFSCAVCAEEIKSASDFIESARQIVQDDLKTEIYRKAMEGPSLWEKFRRSIMQPLPALACALLVVVGGFSVYQNGVTIPQLKLQAAAVQPQGMTLAQMTESKTFVLAESRDKTEALVVPAGQPFRLQVDMPGDSSSYRADINTMSGNSRLSFKISGKEARNPIPLVVPAGVLQPGSYIVVIQGVTSNGTESGIKGKPVRLPFQLKIQD